MKRTNLKTTVVVVVASKLKQRHWLGLVSPLLKSVRQEK